MQVFWHIFEKNVPPDTKISTLKASNYNKTIKPGYLAVTGLMVCLPERLLIRPPVRLPNRLLAHCLK
jgi:hypothetical protein